MSATDLVLLHRHGADDPALVSGVGEVLARDELLRIVRGTAAGLPIADGARVLLACEDRWRFAIATLAVWSKGGVVVLPPNLRPGTIAELRPEVAYVMDDRIAIARADDPGDEWLPLQGWPAQRPLAILHTSGTTSAHRSMGKSVQQLVGEARALVEAFGFAPGERILATVPPHHIYGFLFGLLVPWMGGAAPIAAAPLHASSVAAIVRRHAVASLVSTPAHLRGLELLDADELAVARVFSSGAPLPAETATMLRERFGAEVVEVFGSTETGGIAWRSAADATPWQPLPGVQVSAGDDGRLLLDSPFVPSDAPRPWPADDRIELVGDGRFWHRGRLDDVVKVGGKRVSLRALEERLLGLTGVTDAAVVAAPSADGRGVRLRAAVAGRSSAEHLRDQLLQWFDPVVVPRVIKIVDALPRESTGKLAKERLSALFDQEDEVTVMPGRQPVELVFHEAPIERDDLRRYDLDVPADLRWFEGHFPRHPVLPGVVQLDAIVQRARLAWPDLAHLQRVRRLKFKQPIRPGERLEVVLHRIDREVRFELRDADGCRALGAMVFAEPDA